MIIVFAVLAGLGTAYRVHSYRFGDISRAVYGKAKGALLSVGGKVINSVSKDGAAKALGLVANMVAQAQDNGISNVDYTNLLGEFLNETSQATQQAMYDAVNEELMASGVSIDKIKSRNPLSRPAVPTKTYNN